jgi:PleD family two-component response regulator
MQSVLPNRLRSKVAAQLYEYELYHLNVTLSIGIASYRHDEGLQEVMARADGKRCILLKMTGRNRVVARG